MDENQKQNVTGSDPASLAGILVKDYDGRLKVLSDGELKEIDSLLKETQVQHEPKAQPQLQKQQLDFPKFTDLATVPLDEHFKEPVGEKIPGAVADLHFHPEDKEEIQREIEKIASVFELTPQKKYGAQKIARKIADKHSLNLSPEAFVTFSKVLLSFFRQMRSAIEVKEEMARPQAEGGLGLAKATIEHVIAVAKHLKEKIEEVDGTIVDEDLEVVQPQAAIVTEQPLSEQPPPSAEASMPRVADIAPQATKPPPAVKSAMAQMPEEPSASKKDEGIIRPASPVVPEMTPVKQAAVEALWPKTEKTEEIPATQDMPQPELMPEQKPVVVGTRPTFPQESILTPVSTPQSDLPKMQRPMVPLSGAPVIQDVRRADSRRSRGSLTGRVEELANMDIATWRMLDENARIRAGKILGKIQNLERESFTRKSQGIEAWRGSEVYKMYLRIGELSLEKGKDVSKIIEEMTSAGQQTLTLEEFEAISDLNRMLRY